MSSLSYPSPRRCDQFDDLHGSTINDPYRWMEDPDAEETKQFVADQQGVTNPFLAACGSRKEIESKLRTYYDYEKVGCPFRVANRYYYRKNSGLQNQSVLYYKESLHGESKVFVDPNTWSEDGTTALSTIEFSHDGSLVLFSISEKGSDWKTAKFRRTNSSESGNGEWLEDKLEWIKFSSFAWTHDNSGVFYASFDKPSEVSAGLDKGTEGASNTNQKLYFHKLGTPQHQDKLIYSSSEHANYMWGAEVSDDGLYLIISVRESCEPKNLVYYADLSDFSGGKNGLEIKKLITEFEDEFTYITNDFEKFYFQTKESVLCIDLQSPAKDAWQTIIPKSEYTLE